MSTSPLSDERMADLEVRMERRAAKGSGIIVLSHGDLRSIFEEVRELRKQNGTLTQALDDIAHPIAALQRYAESEGAILDGMMAIHLSNDAGYLKGEAEKALNSARTASQETRD